MPRIAPSDLVEIDRISGPAARHYARLVPGRYRDRVASGSLEPELVLVGASAFGAPAGAALAQLAPDGVARFESLYVARAFRRDGIGAALAARLDEVLAMHPAVALFVRDAPSGEAVEAVAARLGWSRAAPHAREYAFGRRALEAPVLNGRGSRKGLRLVAFADLQEALPPFEPAPGDLLAEVSFAAFRGADLVGWSTMHEQRPGAATWSALRIVPDSNGFGVAHALVARTVRAALERPGIECVRGIVVLGNRPMERIVSRWFAPYVDYCRLLHATHRPARRV